jgi:predicted kinase
MRKLVVLVGLSGSGKTTFCKKHPEWAVVSKDHIRRMIFHRDFDLSYEDVVDRIFTAALVEAVDSPAQVVCVDNTNLTREERRSLIEVALLSGREPIAYVMPLLPLETMYKRKMKQLEELARNCPEIVVGGFSRERYERIYRSYEAVCEDEGFARVIHEVPPLQPRRRAKRVRRTRRRREGEVKPLPLFA